MLTNKSDEIAGKIERLEVKTCYAPFWTIVIFVQVAKGLNNELSTLRSLR